jgi:hypothetical protein
MKVQIVSKWQVTDLSEPSKIIRIKITRESDYITISQKQYIVSILCKEKMERANPIAIPLDPNVPIKPNPDPSDDNRSNPFMHLLDKLQYLTNTTHLDITFTVIDLHHTPQTPAHYTTAC